MNVGPKLVVGSALVLVMAVLPLSTVAAHACWSVFVIHPADPNDPNTGCDGADCPCKHRPHYHENLIPPQKCTQLRGSGCSCRPLDGEDIICVECPPDLAHLCPSVGSSAAADLGRALALLP